MFGKSLGPDLGAERGYYHWQRDDFVPLGIFELNDQLDVAELLLTDEFQGLNRMAEIEGGHRMGSPDIQETIVKLGMDVL